MINFYALKMAGLVVGLINSTRFADYMRKVHEGRGPEGADQEFVDKTYNDWMAGKGASPCSVFNKNYKADCR